MAIGIRGRTLYTILVSVTFVISVVVTGIFEGISLEQTKISAKSGMLFTILILLRITNYLITIATLCMTITMFTPGPNSPAVPFGLANATVMFAIFSLFFVFEFMSAAHRYETETLKSFNLKTKESREMAAEQLNFLKSIHSSMKCCGLNGYQDFERDKFSTDGAVGDDVDVEDQHVKYTGTRLVWGDFLRGASVNYSFTDRCGINNTRPFEVKGQTLSASEDVPLSCCKSTRIANCNSNVFSTVNPINTTAPNATAVGTTNINMQGCNAILLRAIKKVNTPIICGILFVYPWIVSIYGMIITWAYLCDVRGLPFKVFGFYLCRKPQKAVSLPQTKSQPPSEVGSPASGAGSPRSEVGSGSPRRSIQSQGNVELE